MEKQLVGQGVDFRFLDAVDGNNLDSPKYSCEPTGSRLKMDPGRGPSGLTNEELGCALSHLLVYQKMLDDDVNVACVLEDDVELAPGFIDIIAAPAVLQGKWELLLLGHYSNHLKSRTLGGEIRYSRKKVAPGYCIGQPVEFCYSAVGYILRKTAARKMLQYAQPLRMPADHVTANSVISGVRLYALKPTCVLPSWKFKSTIPGRTRNPPKRYPVFRFPLVLKKLGMMSNSYVRCSGRYGVED